MSITNSRDIESQLNYWNNSLTKYNKTVLPLCLEKVLNILTQLKLEELNTF